jgi:eukaryotic-like serine/threonine-protein kinase
VIVVAEHMAQQGPAARGPQGPRPLAPGAPLAAGYEVIEHLSRGRDFDVYFGWSEHRECGCAVKLIRPDRVESASASRRLLGEGRLLRGLTHPHIVRLYDMQDRPAVLVLETLTGETLDHMICGPRRLALADVAMLGLQLCSAIGYLHRQGYLHLDLKPSNIICDNGQAKLLDLSIARRPGPSRAGVGTPRYMAPEQARGGEMRRATDVWGMGAVLFCATAGRPPAAWCDAECSYPQLWHRAEPLRRHRRLPAAFGNVIEATLDPDPDKRPTVGELAGALDPLV